MTNCCHIFSERIPARADTQGQQIRADVTDPDGLAEVVLHDGHLLGGALGAQQPATVPAVVLPGGEAELVLEENGSNERLERNYCYQTLLTAVSFPPAGLL